MASSKGSSQGSSHSGEKKSSGGTKSANNTGNFKNDPERASEAGKKGGEHSHGGSSEQSHKKK